MSIHISEKLEISRRLGYLSLIDEGVYLRIYNQSAYIINQLYQQNLKIASHVIGKLQQYQIVYCAFPKKISGCGFIMHVKHHGVMKLKGILI